MMIRQLTEQDRAQCLAFVSEKPAENLFIIGDIEAFGFDQEFQKIWGEFDENGELKAVLLKFNENYIPYATGTFNIEGFADIMNQDPEFSILSGLKHITEKFKPYIKHRSKEDRVLYYAKLEQMNSLELSLPHEEVKELTVEEIPKLVELYYKIPFKSAARNGAKSHQTSMEKGVARTYYIEREGKLVSVASTAAENSQSAMIVGVGTHPDYKRQGMATTVLTKLCKDMLKTGRTLCLFYDNPEAGSIYKRIGFEDIGMWTMFQYEQKIVKMS
ncbi:GNAT family N-acetyltransferase [Bacillus kexueae]|uniref:GNAT family N-acetyltransferase n=1 Tax=Aeribacillus kexueae TaxID=2078952 RepID=UPI00311A970F